MFLMIVGKMEAQSLVCNDLVEVSLDGNCAYTMVPEDVLEGTIWPNCIVEVDKVPPLGNGPWVPAVFSSADVDKTYQVRVKHLPSGNACWGNVSITDNMAPVLQCTGLTTVTLDAGGTASIGVGDLNLSVTDGCTAPANVDLSFPGNQSSLIFDCNNLGINIINLSATDASGNTASCPTTVLVEGGNVCLSCVSTCPPPLTVTFDEGYNTLRPAFQNADWSAFDAFGNALFDHGNCTYQDSTYSVEYHPGTAGQSWFLRKWEWTDGSGATVGSCEQPIVFTSSFTVNVTGKVFFDNTPNCTFDAGEPGVNGLSIVATHVPSGATQTITPAADGSYSLLIELNVPDSAAHVYLQLPPGVSSVCPSALSIPYASGPSSYTFDIGLRTLGDCALMQGSLNSFTSRRCQVNQFVVQYCNLGLDTAYNAYATVELDTLMSLESVSQGYTAGPGNSFTVPLGAVPPFYCSFFYFSALISCDAELGQTLCSTLTLAPNTPCDGSWTGPDIVATAQCMGDTVNLAVWNQGQQDMASPLNFIVIEDLIMYKDDPFMLSAGDSITIQVPANGSTWRIEAPQVPGHPVSGLVSAALEGCGGLNSPGLINAFPQNDNAVYVDEECVVATGSYDPNDKTAVPTGFDAAHIIRPNDPIEYKIRFQNTGTDAAFRVVVVDTLSALLDWNTLQTGASSHPYRLDIYPGGIIQFVFDPIVLPDSNANEPASHGFVTFRIAQQPDLPLGTVIENTAAIYFDLNEPVITNTAFHTLGQLYMLLDNQTALAPGIEASLTPNPFSDQSVLEVQGETLHDAVLSLYDSQGRLLRSLPVRNNRALIERQGMEAGVYFFRVTENGIGVVGGKIVVK